MTRPPLRSVLLRAVAITLASATSACPRGADEGSSPPSAQATSSSVTAAASADVVSASRPLSTASSSPPLAPAPEPRTIVTRGEHSAYLVPATGAHPTRLIAGLHGVCNPPEYACGLWAGAARTRGVLLCPSGNARCGAAAYNAPTWQGSFVEADELLEAARDAAARELGVELGPEGAILMGFSRGAFHAVKIAAAHPGRWPLLLLVEADATLHPVALRAAGVRAVALLAGERSGQLGGMRASAKALERADYPARLWVMPDAGHHYSSNIEQLMAEALDFLRADHGAGAGDGGKAD